MRRFMTMCVALLLTSAHAYAACRDDLEQLKPRVERVKFSDKDRYALANKWLGAAEKAEPYDEIGCHNYYIRALRAMTQPMDAAPNHAAVPGGAAGAGSSVAPVGPVTQPPAGPGAPRFTPPPMVGPNQQKK